MARTFNKAYDHINQMLNGSGLSPIVYRQGAGSIVGRGLQRAYKDLPSTAKFYLRQFQDKDITDKELKSLLTEDEIYEISKAIERNEAAEKGDKPLLDREGNPVLDDDGSVMMVKGPVEGEVTWETPGYRQIAPQGLSHLFNASPLFNLQNTLGKFKYGPPNLAGERIITDKYNWHQGGDKPGFKAVLDSIRRDKHVPIKFLAENIAASIQGKKGKGPRIRGKINPYKWKFGESGTYDYGQDRGMQGSLRGMEGYSYDPQTDTSFIDDAAIDTIAAFKHGGQTMSGGLSGIRKSININGEPHNLAWINSDEASALRAMGGSGKPGPMGIPSYQFGWGDYPAESYQDQPGADVSFSGDPYSMSEEVITPEQMAIAESAIGQSGYPQDISVLPQVTESWEEVFDPKSKVIMGDRARIARAVDEAQKAGRGLHPSERRDRSISRDALRTTLEESLPTLERQRGPQELSQAYPWWAPFALPIKALGGIAGWLRGNTAPVIATVMVEGERMNLHEDGTLSEIRAGDQTTEDADLYKQPLPIQTAREGLTSTVKEEEKELTGIAKLLDKRKDKPTKGETLQPQFDNIVAAGFSRQEAADMLNQPVNIFA